VQEGFESQRAETVKGVPVTKLVSSISSEKVESVEMMDSADMILQRTSRSLATGCVQAKSLQTPFDADTVVYGTMFTVTTHADPIEMLTMEISANPIGAGMDIEIYTKIGDFTGAENDPSQWKQIVNTTLVPAREGHGTIIPTTEFKSIKMNENEIHAFLVTLKTSDLRYKRSADNMNLGQAFVSDAYLSINSGIGISQYGFSSNIFPSRLFTGIFHYTHPSDCSDPTSKLLITYSFHARPKGSTSMSKAQIIEEINSQVDRSVNDLLNSGLSTVRDEYNVTVVSVDSVAATTQEGTSRERQ
jgi:hypothetical protein